VKASSETAGCARADRVESRRIAAVATGGESAGFMTADGIRESASRLGNLASPFGSCRSIRLNEIIRLNVSLQEKNRCVQARDFDAIAFLSPFNAHWSNGNAL